MADIRRLTDTFSVAGQITADDVPAVAGRGFVLIINNRPDGEAPGQPTGAAIEAAARAAGVAYLEIPVSGRVSPEQASAMAAAVEDAGGKTLAYCRTGNRSSIIWARGMAAAGRFNRAELIALAGAAGYDISGAL